MKDLLIGASDTFEWNQIKPWCRSIRETSFSGDVVLIVYRGNLQHIDAEAKKLDITVLNATHDEWGRLINHEAAGRHTMAWQIRFFHIWQYLTDNTSYRNVITTDTRDVIFQNNPSEWLEKNLKKDIIAPSEGIRYKDEEWGKQNLLAGFGPYVYEQLKDNTICNIGTIAGSANAIADFSLILYSMGSGRYVPNDQSSFNVLINSKLLDIQFVSHDEAWCCQCGTVLDPAKIDVFRPNLTEKEPLVKNGKVYTSDGNLFYLVHQWDRIPGLAVELNKKYED